MRKVIKRNGEKVDFDGKKIYNAILKAMKNGSGVVEPKIASNIVDKIDLYTQHLKEVRVSDIETDIFDLLIYYGQNVTARAYEGYRKIREFQRDTHNTIDTQLDELLDGTSDYWNNENSNKNAKLLTTQRDYMAGIVSTDITRRFLLPSDVVQAHDDGIIHFHDADYFAQNAITNCCLCNLEDMLQNGTCINKVKIDKPHRLITATTIATQIITAVSSSQYGGISITLTHLAPFVRDSYNIYLKKYIDRGLPEDQCIQFAKEDLHKEVSDAVQTFNYQVNSMTTTNGQAPFLSVFMYLGETDEYKEELAMLIEEFLKQRIVGMKNEVGVYVTQAFPKLLYVLEEDNITPESKYWDLTVLAAKCTAKRMVPDYISEKKMREYKLSKGETVGNGDVYPCMGCRSFLTPDRSGNGWDNIANAKNYDGKPKYYGRFNCGVVTINLPDIALSSGGDMDKFWEIFEKRMELCHKALKCRYKRLEGCPSDVAPILWQDGAFARLEKGEKIDKLLHGGYCTISLGYAGLYECVKYMTGYSHSDEGEGESFGLKVMQALNDKCNQWKAEEDIDYSVYGSPIESTTYKFAKSLKERFGIVPGITDKNYITNSYHIHVEEEIDPFEKLRIEAKFQKLSPGGAISYVECADLTRNIDVVLKLLQYIYDNIMYAELNTKSDYCQVCGYDGEIKIIDEDGELVWECPNCGNRDKDKLNVCRRTCGYLGHEFWNQGRTAEIKDRYVHCDNHEA